MKVSIKKRRVARSDTHCRWCFRWIKRGSPIVLGIICENGEVIDKEVFCSEDCHDKADVEIGKKV